jgi:diaminopimelate epimerase
MRFTKGHGTGNDFVIVDEEVRLTPQLVVAICDRRFGIGGDGVLRVAREGARFFMDYWNSDGSLSEMCGNGVRVFARYLWEAGLVTGPSTEVATRAGVRTAYLEWDGIRVDMGAPRILGTSRDGLAISMGNPHLVYEVDSVDKIDLSRPPSYDDAFFPEGVNVSYFERASAGHVKMRVYERGSGETFSCGTGATAVGVAALHNQGQRTGAVIVDVPGGRLRVTVDKRTSWLAGPAVLVATGQADPVDLSGRAVNPAEHPWPQGDRAHSASRRP